MALKIQKKNLAEVLEAFFEENGYVGARIHSVWKPQIFRGNEFYRIYFFAYGDCPFCLREHDRPAHFFTQTVPRNVDTLPLASFGCTRDTEHHIKKVVYHPVATEFYHLENKIRHSQPY